MRLSHPMKILTILIGTLVLNMFDASNCRADETVTEAMLRAESLGRLRLGLPEMDVLKLLGSPATRGELVFQEADGNYVQDWHYPDKGIELLMSAGEKKSGVKTIANITASAPCTFERVQVNADRIENDLPRHHCHDKNDRGIHRSTQRGATPLRAGKGCRQPGKNCHVTDRVNRRPNSGEIFANLDEQRRHGESGNGLHQRLSESEGKLRHGGSRRGRV